MAKAAHQDATLWPMRTTVNLDPDVAAAVARLRRESGIGLSDAVNALARGDARATGPSERFVQPTADLGIRLDLTNIAEALDLLEA